MPIFIKNNNFQKPLSACLLLVLTANLIIGGVLLPYQQAQAALATSAQQTLQMIKDAAAKARDWVYDAWAKIQSTIQTGYQSVLVSLGISKKVQDAIGKVLKVAWDRLRVMLLNMLVNDIVKWIQGGGKPRFVTDWQGFLETAADKAAGQFISQNLGAGFLCGPFAAQLQIALAKPPTFNESVTCTLSDITDNIDDFFSDFSNGGWKGWITVTEPQNNIFGADLLALDRRYDLMAEAREASKSEAGTAAGFLGDKVCVAMFNAATKDSQTMDSYNGYKESDIPEGYKCTKWSTRTPGRVIGDSLQQAVGKDMQMLLSADEFSEYAGAIIDAVISRTIREGILALTGTGSANAAGAGITTPAYVSADTAAIVDSGKGEAVMETIIQQENLLKENLNSAINEYQKNLDLLNQVKTSQENSVIMLQYIAGANWGCAMPQGSSLGQTTTLTQGNCNTTACPCTDTATQTTPFTIDTLGSGTLKQTTTQQYTVGANGVCDSVTYSAANSSIIDSSQSLGSFSQIQTDITAFQQQVNQASTTIVDSINYQKAVTAYSDAYDALLLNTGTQANASSTETTMLAAKDKLLISIKALTGSDSNELTEQMNALMQLSIVIAQKVNDAQTKRGYSSDCEFAETGSHQAALCASQAQETLIKSSYNSCLASQYNWNF